MAVRTVYIQLLDEGVDVWRPVEADAESEDVFRLPEHAPEDEVWRFPPGSRVRCQWRQLSDGPALVATELVE